MFPDGADSSGKAVASEETKSAAMKEMRITCWQTAMGGWVLQEVSRRPAEFGAGIGNRPPSFYILSPGDPGAWVALFLFFTEDHTPSLPRQRIRALLSVEQLSMHARVSCAFIHLCAALGCPKHEGRLSQAILLEWLFEHYGPVRAQAGLPEMASLDGLSEEMTAKLKMGNALLTLLEFSETRSSNPDEKRRIRNVRQMVALAMDRR